MLLRGGTSRSIRLRLALLTRRQGCKSIDLFFARQTRLSGARLRPLVARCVPAVGLTSRAHVGQSASGAASRRASDLAGSSPTTQKKIVVDDVMTMTKTAASVIRKTEEHISAPEEEEEPRLDSVDGGGRGSSSSSNGGGRPGTERRNTSSGGDGERKRQQSSALARLRLRIVQNRWAKLIKLELSAFVCMTTVGGYLISGGSLFDLTTFSGAVIGTMMCAGSAATFNQIRERRFDAQMARTRRRPLAQESMPVGTARAFGWATLTGGCALLWTTANPITAALGLATHVLYVQVYTPLKRRTRFNTEVGAIVGAIPPVMGWTAALDYGGLAHPEALFLALTLYAWQMQHFMTIAWKNRKDYASAGFVMQSLNDPEGRSTTRKGAAWLLVMCALPFISCAVNFTNPMFAVTGSLANLYLCRHYYRFYKKPSPHTSRWAMIAGFLQLTAFFALLIFHLQDRDSIRGFRQLDQLRQNGLEHCAYQYHKAMDGAPHWCVYLFGRSKKSEETTEQQQVTDQSAAAEQSPPAPPATG